MITPKEYAIFIEGIKKFSKILNPENIEDLKELFKPDEMYELSIEEKNKVNENLMLVLIKIDRILEKTQLKDSLLQKEVVKTFRILWNSN